MSWPKSLKLIKRLPALCLRLHLTNRSRTACHRWAAASQIGYSKASAALSSSSSRSKWRSPLVRRGPKTKPKRGAHNYVWELQTANGRKGLCNFSIEFSPRALPLEWIRHPLLLFSTCLLAGSEARARNSKQSQGLGTNTKMATMWQILLLLR